MGWPETANVEAPQVTDVEETMRRQTRPRLAPRRVVCSVRNAERERTRFSRLAQVRQFAPKPSLSKLRHPVR